VAAAGLADGGAGPSVAEPRLTRPEEMRASMPPFFGSNAEAGPSPVQGEARAPGTGAVQQAAPRAAGTAAIAPASDAMVHEVSMVAAAAEAAAARPSPAGHSPSLNGGAPGLFEASAPAAGEAAHNRALEVMVLDLLKPMLRQWLDENMPRLVAEALAEEVQRSRAAKGDAKTS
jgi:cell pole-organizing protein PopZ